ncbi:MAG TPA: hypothetical protein VL422_06090 [Miltoncostaea sp.]|jgi:hypothetical protein|nr:hypothetical protein [Miltoncostaea sp.]
MPVPVAPPEEALALAEAAPVAVLGLTMPRCSACMLLPASLAEIRRARPGVEAVIAEFAGPADWEARERLLWPRGIHVSRASVPAMALLVDGEVVARRQGGGPAGLIDAWLADHLGPAAAPLGSDPTPAELVALAGIGDHLAGQRAAKAMRAPEPGL